MVTFRLAQKNDYPNINNFYNRIHNKNRSLDQFEWEFHNGPFGPSVYIIAEDDEKVIGTNCVIPIDLIRSNGEIIKSGKSEDTLVDPDYRGQGIFYKIYEVLFEKCKSKGIQLIWGFTPAKKPFEKVGFRIPYDHEQSLLVNNIIDSYKYLISLDPHNNLSKKVKIFALCLASKLKSKTITSHIVSKRFRVVQNENIVDKVDELIQGILNSNSGHYAILQNGLYQKWRIYDNPNLNKIDTYGFYNKKDQLQALIVINTSKNRISYFSQNSFSSDLSKLEVIGILQYVTSDLFKKGSSLIRNWHFATNNINIEEINHFSKAGFVHLKRGIGLVWKELVPLDLEAEHFLLSRMSTQGIV
jgi:GNAT superfamily N-acetyltransferase